MQRISTRLAPWSRLNYTPAAGAERGLPHGVSVLLLAIASLLIGCVVVKASGPTTLKEAFKNDFLIGVAINEKQSENQDPRGDPIIETQFDCISPENCLKWEPVHPRPNQYHFGPADQYVEFGLKHHMFIVGHNLIWRYQTPGWVFQDDRGKPISREALIKRMHDHIFTVMGRYKGKINGWDVVNEALNEDGTLYKSPWEKIIGPDYIVMAYKFAHEADPNAQLYYNDYMLVNKPKRDGAIALIRKLQEAGVPIAAVGEQAHYNLTSPTPEALDETIKAFAKLGVKVIFSELDLDVLPPATQSQSAEVSMNFALQARLNPYTNGLPASVQEALAKRYASLFKVFVANRGAVMRVTFWGVTDGDSWLNNWPVKGRTAYPLLFDRDGKPKPAFHSVINAALPRGAEQSN